MTIKQLTEIKTTVNTTSTLVTCEDNSLDKTPQKNNKPPLKNKNANKNLTNTKTLSTTDNFTCACQEHPINENIVSTNGKNTSKASEKSEKKIIVMRLQIGTATTMSEIIRIKRMFIFMAIGWLKN